MAKFQKGHRLSVGNSGPVRHNMISQVLISQLNEIDPKTQKAKLHKIVDELIRQALGFEKKILHKNTGKLIKIQVPGDIVAIKEIIDRVQGKAHQAVTVVGDPENPLN